MAVAVVHSGGHKIRPGFSGILVFRLFLRNRGMGDGSPTLSAIGPAKRPKLRIYLRLFEKSRWYTGVVTVRLVVCVSACT